MTSAILAATLAATSVIGVRAPNSIQTQLEGVRRDIASVRADLDQRTTHSDIRYSRLKIYCALARLGVWPTVEAWLKTKDFDGVNGLDAFNYAQEVSNENPLFEPLVSEAATVLGWTREQVDALLAECILDN